MAWPKKAVHCLLAGLLLVGGASSAHADEVTGFSFPAARAEQLGMSPAELEEAKRYALSAGGSGMIVRRGRAVMRWGDQQKRYDIKSATKSFGATMLGVAIKEGKIELDAPARRYHPTLGVPPQSNVQTGWLDEITIRHLATQTAGFEKPGGYERLLFKPGTQWHYSDGGPNWLAECITLQYRRDLEELMFDRVFTPLGITRDDLRWRKNQYREHEIDGIPRREFGAGIHANVEALARLGYLYLNNGRWQNDQILPQAFVALVSRPMKSVIGRPEWSDTHGNASEHYSLLWWNNGDGAVADVPRDAYWAWGLYDSLIVVIPSLDLVVVRGGERGRSLPREEGASHYDVLQPFLGPIVASVNTSKVQHVRALGSTQLEQGFVPLFDGETLKGWQGATEHWAAEHGSLVFIREGAARSKKELLGLKLMSTKEYADFILRFDIKLPKESNNGVAIRAPLEGDPAFVGMEIQVQDPQYYRKLKDYEVFGSVYGVVAAKTGHLKLNGQWNTEEILCVGGRVRVTLNGTVIVDVNLGSIGAVTKDGADHPGLKRTKGHIGFCGHTGRVEYRNIRIKDFH